MNGVTILELVLMLSAFLIVAIGSAFGITLAFLLQRERDRRDETQKFDDAVKQIGELKKQVSERDTRIGLLERKVETLNDTIERLVGGTDPKVIAVADKDL